MKTLYPEILPFHTFMLETGSQHLVYVEQSGNPDGIPVIFLHGGPCSGTKPDHRRFFNPEHYHIILFDQRGCGKSLPFGELEHNTTQDLIDDMERIREQLAIKQWLLFGGSWGAALALLYAQKHQDKVLAMILRGTFLARQQDMNWFLGNGAGLIYPELWQQLVESIPVHWRDNLLAGLFSTVWHDDIALQQRAANAWMAWGAQVALGNLYLPASTDTLITEDMIKQVRMELHFAKHGYFIAENQILDNSKQLSNLPAIIIHGRQDLVCPMEAGFSLHKTLPNAEFVVLATAGHIAQGDEMIDALVNATDTMVNRLSV
ncbi:MAG: prolyl aminopeptidase [Methylococcaceae bacterium]|nr:prolyl aminopeptidase [Methylococcaceae bacterium]MDZ4157609.1 prolyl aminopeptidase [Methylococcales bacterium]MDP2393139.1 prolyl aminopeptidase [Methylococcaceae bacterium]MDP3019283.1 prolyl aminopeptidase [Methylococcaceae bacterium]MDP3389137.1 prolyl aminopeptidase [Methylococcaceae bacterium]